MASFVVIYLYTVTDGIWFLMDGKYVIRKRKHFCGPWKIFENSIGITDHYIDLYD